MPAATLLVLSFCAGSPAVPSSDGGTDIIIVRADRGFPPPIPLGLLPADAGPPKLLWPKDLVSVSDVGPQPTLEAYVEAKQAFDAALYPRALNILEAEAKRSPLPLEARYLRALALLRAGLSAEAARELITLADLMPTLRARCLFSAAVALEDQRAFATAAAVYAKAAAAGPESAIHRDAVLGEVRMRIASGELTRAEDILAPLAESAAPPTGFGRDVGAEALFSLAQVAERRGQGKRAGKYLRELWAKHPLSPLADSAGERAKALGMPEASAAEQLGRAEVVLNANRNVQAIAVLTPLAAKLKLSPHPTETACAAHFALARALKKQRHHSAALAQFGAVLEACQSEGGAELRARALYLAGQSAAVVDPPLARKYFTQLAEEFPSNSFADDALFFAADVESKALGDAEAAKAALAALVERYPTGDYIGEARFKLFWLAHQAGVGAAAGEEAQPAPKGTPEPGIGQLTLLAKSVAETTPRPPEPVLRARYWLAQASPDPSKSESQLQALAAEWPANYYGDLAREALSDKAAAATPPDSAPLPTALHAGTMLEDANFKTGLALLRLGFAAAADEELLRVERQGIAGPTGRAEPMLLLALALDRAGDPRAAHAIAKQLIEADDDFTAQPQTEPVDRSARSALTRLLFKVAYPRAFRPQIEKWSLAANVPPDLLQGLMREESALDPQALSGAGAVGLCQLMPTTGKQVARKLGLGSITPEDLQQPDLNIRLGAAYLGQLLKRYGGRKPLAVAAYNAGEGAVDRSLQAAKGQPLDAFVEEIPIAETRNYVKRVLTSAAVYRTLPPESPLVAAQ